jgi:hypothetical protein
MSWACPSIAPVLTSAGGNVNTVTLITVHCLVAPKLLRIAVKSNTSLSANSTDELGIREMVNATADFSVPLR